jgi:hypothetical protein
VRIAATARACGTTDFDAVRTGAAGCEGLPACTAPSFFVTELAASLTGCGAIRTAGTALSIRVGSAFTVETSREAAAVGALATGRWVAGFKTPTPAACAAGAQANTAPKTDVATTQTRSRAFKVVNLEAFIS